ncbi:hypothetical protein ACFCZT_07795 [Streptomyces sp. NPDC056230]|uniref:hypothetical protein n=1 Tax=Streptomyces sp. NPDC056230 TaxID=3345754 RepID=UPI0035D5EBF2
MQIPAFDNWLPQERPTSAKMNANIRDAGNFFRSTPFAWAHRTAALSVADAAWTEIPLDTEKADTDNMFSTASGFVIVTPGWYSVSGGMRYTSNVNGYRGCRLRVSGADADVTYTPAINGTQTTVRADAELYCNVGDTLSLGGFSSVAVSLHVPTPYYCFLRARWMAA